MIHHVFFLIFFLIIGLSQKVLDPPGGRFSKFNPHGTHHRQPASLRLTCRAKLQGIVEASKPRSRYRFWKRWLGIPQERFNKEKYEELAEIYEQSLKDDDSFPIEESKEGVLAYIKAHGRHVAPELPELNPRLSRFKEAHLEGIVERLKKRGVLETKQIDDLTRDLFLTAFGPEVPLKSFFNDDDWQKELLLRVIQEDLASRGLSKVFTHYKLSQKKPSFLQKFRRSVLGKSALTGLFNLPMFVGWPPLWLPGFKPFRLSDELAQEIYEKGLTEDVFRRIEMKFGGNLKDKARLQIIRNYYNRGIMIFVTLAALYDTYQLNKELDEESRVIQEATQEAAQVLDSAARLEHSGIDIFKEDGVAKGESFCEAIRGCLKQLGITIEEVSDNDPNLQTCRSLMDPHNRCTSL